MGTELNPNAFAGRAAAPSDEELSAALGPSRAAWDQLLTKLAETFSLTEREWRSYSPKAGWHVRVRKGKRNILYLAPCVGCFRIAFIFGGKAVAAAREGEVPARVLKLIEDGDKYPEGTGVRIEVKSARSLAPLEALTKLKLAH